MKRYTITLRHLILLVAILSMALTLVSSLYSGYRIEKETLINNSLETNRVYAEKLANTTDSFFENILAILEYSAKEVAPFVGNDEERLLQEANRLKNQMNHFHAVSIVDVDGEILALSPEALNGNHDMLISPGENQALAERMPFISTPYNDHMGRLNIFISTPIYGESGEFLGFIGGSLYLNERNHVLYELLGQYCYSDDSYVDVMDSNGQVLFHEGSDNVYSSIPFQQQMKSSSGSQRMTNPEDEDLLAGYAYVTSAGWLVVSQQPTKLASSPAKKMVQEALFQSIPLILVTIVIISLFARQIAKPLNLLALYTENSGNSNQKAEFSAIKASYYEAIQLKQVLEQSLSFLHERVDHFMYESTTDPLTKLTNRRTLYEKMNYFVTNNVPFSLILIDIDHFKRVNDTYGHSVGDEVLQFLADEMVQLARKDDICCRYGGEEFIILLPFVHKKDAYQVAERFRRTIESKKSPTGEAITVSAGIATYPDDANELEKIIPVADKCLYEAKESGRNQTVVHEHYGWNE